MGDPVSTSLVTAVSGALVAGSTVHQVQQTRKASREADQQARRSLREQAQVQRAMRQEMAQGESDKARMEERAMMRERQRAMGGQGRRSQIMTGPLGLQGGAPGERRSILGG